MSKDRRRFVTEVRETRWIDDGWAEADGDGVVIVSVSGPIEFRARCSWHQFIRFHMASKELIAGHLASSNVYTLGNDCEACVEREAG